jgi:hypothetical protein
MRIDPADHPHAGPVSARRSKPAQRDNFNPGHNVHWIQANKFGQHLHEAEVGRVVRVDQRGVHVEVDGELRRYGTRNLQWLEELVATSGPKALIQHRWALMHVGKQLFNIRGPL